MAAEHEIVAGKSRQRAGHRPERQAGARRADCCLADDDAYVLTDDQGQYDVGWLLSWEHPDGLCLMARHIERNLAALADISRRAIRVDILLAPVLAISGTVTDSAAAALSGATVSVELCKWSWACGTPVRNAVTDGAGGFTFSALPQLQEYRLCVAAAGYPIRRLATGVIYTVKDREEMDPISPISPRAPAQDTGEFGRLLIRVLDEDHKPVDVTSMQLWTQQEGGGATASSLLLLSTPEPGLYEVDQIPVGSNDRLSIYVENLAPLSLADVEGAQGPAGSDRVPSLAGRDHPRRCDR